MDKLNALVQFGGRNTRSYSEEVELSLEALRVSNHHVIHDITTTTSKPSRILPVAAVYGANASGKSTLLKSMIDMRNTVMHSVQQKSDSFELRHPFLLRVADEEESNHPTDFQIELIIKGIPWQYGFSVDDSRVIREYAYYYPHGKRALAFEREDFELKLGSTVRKFNPTLSSDWLYLSLVGVMSESDHIAESVDEKLGSLYRWFTVNLKDVSSENFRSRLKFTSDMKNEKSLRNTVLNYLRAADLGITDLETVRENNEFLSRLKEAFDKATQEDEATKIDDEEVKLRHRSQNGDILFDSHDESIGTMTWVALIGPIIEALSRGTVLLVDELDSSLHPNLVKHVITLFQNPQTNPNCAQLIFNTHNTEFLDSRDRFALGRDQIWFSEKDECGSTSLFSLSDFKTRQGQAFGKLYSAGRYGAVPTVIPAYFELNSSNPQEDSEDSSESRHHAVN